MSESMASAALRRSSIIAGACSLVSSGEGGEDNDQTTNRLIPVRFGNLALSNCQWQRSKRPQIGRYSREFVIGLAWQPWRQKCPLPTWHSERSRNGHELNGPHRLCRLQPVARAPENQAIVC
jgi:hypothetical protein